MELNVLLRQILFSLYRNKVIVASWGISDIRISNDLLSFHANGMKKQETITISVSSFPDIEITIGKDLFILHEIGDVVNFIDSQIERTEYYSEDLRKWIIEKYLQ